MSNGRVQVSGAAVSGAVQLYDVWYETSYSTTERHKLVTGISEAHADEILASLYLWMPVDKAWIVRQSLTSQPD